MHRTTLLVVCLGAGVTAWAQEQGAGLRRRFEENSVTAGAAYITEGFTDGRAGAALGNLTARLELDLRRLHFSRGQVFTSVQALHGSGVNDRLIGTTQCPSNLEDDPFRKWGEVWYADTRSPATPPALAFGGRTANTACTPPSSIASLPTPTGLARCSSDRDARGPTSNRTLPRAPSTRTQVSGSRPSAPPENTGR